MTSSPINIQFREIDGLKIPRFAPASRERLPRSINQSDIEPRWALGAQGVTATAAGRYEIDMPRRLIVTRV